MFRRLLLKLGLRAQCNTMCFSFAIRTMTTDVNQLFEELRVAEFLCAEEDDLARNFIEK